MDWEHFGHVMVGRAKRALSCFVMTLSHSRALYLEFFFDQTMENFLRGHVHAFEAWRGQPRVILYDNLKSAVLERRGQHILFHPRLLELSGHYHFAPRPCQVRAGNQKGAWSAPFAMCVTRSGQRDPSSRWPKPTARLCNGATRWRISGAGLETTIARWPMSLTKSGLVCCRPQCIRFPRTESKR